MDEGQQSWATGGMAADEADLRAQSFDSQTFMQQLELLPGSSEPGKITDSLCQRVSGQVPPAQLSWKL